MSAIRVDGLPPAASAAMEQVTESTQLRQAGDAHAVKTGGKKTIDKSTAAQFEAIFLRKMLSSLQKTANVGGSESSSGAVYSSMITDGLADSIAKNGGIGLQDALMHAMHQGDPDGQGNRK